MRVGNGRSIGRAGEAEESGTGEVGTGKTGRRILESQA